MAFNLFRRKKASSSGLHDASSLREQFEDVDGQKIAYLRAGPEQRTVVFIHGNSSCKEAFHAQYQSVLDAQLGVLAIDLPGHGASARAHSPETTYTIPAYAALIRKLCDTLNITAPILCGWSLGGHIAVEMAGTNADYAGLIMFGTPPVRPGLEDLEAAFLPSPFSDVTWAEDPTREGLEAYLDAIYGSPNSVPENLIAAGLRTDGKSRSHAFSHWASGAAGHDHRTVVLNWRKPLLVLHGAEDPFISLDYIRDLLAGRDDDAPVLKILNGVGHAPFLERSEDFNTMLLEFCKTSFGGS